MICIVGLGNPGKEYEQTPHNLGRNAVLRLAELLDAGAFENNKKFRALTIQTAFQNKTLLLTLPETYMNLSGESVAALAAFYKIDPGRVWITHDDADLPLGNVRISFGANAGGHHGVGSVIEKLGSKDFWRFRIGIAPPIPPENNTASSTMPLDAYVVSPNAISPDIFRQSIEKTCMLMLDAIKNGIEGVQKQGD